MGLITKNVKTRWSGITRKHYEDKGYLYTKHNDFFTVAVNDLLKNSNVQVDVRCDGCGVQLNMTFQRYNTCVKEDEKYYCTKCMNKLFIVERATMSKLKNSKTFAEWCIENDKQDILDRWDYDLNKYSPYKVSYSTGKKCWFKCSNDEQHKSELKYISNVIKRGVKCNQCNSFAYWGINEIGNDFLEKYWDYDKNIVNPWEIAKSTSKNKIYIKCQEKNYHGSYCTIPNTFIGGARCGFCTLRKNKIHPYDSLGNELKKRNIEHLFSDKNSESAYELAPNSDKIIWWKCDNEIHGDYKRNVNLSNKYNFRCPQCSKERKESFLQEKIKLYLGDLKYEVFCEHNCNLLCVNPKTGHILPYDNEVTKLNLIIEVHGLQHYELGGWHITQSKYNNTMPEEELKYQQWKDKYKKNYALSQGYFYLEIPYWTDDKNETYKKLIDDKIKKICNPNNITQ